MQTNGAPALKNIVLTLLVVIVFPFLGKSQNVKLYPLSDYEASLRQYHTAKVQTACVEFQAKTKMKWWYYLPNIGFQFGLPSVNAGTNQLVSIDQTKQQNRVKLQAIISQGLLDYRTDLHQLRSLYSALLVERDQLDELKTAWLTQQKIFNVTKEAHEKKEVKPVEYYQALLVLQKEYSAGEERQKQYALKVIEVARFARHQFPAEEGLPGLDSLVNQKQMVLVGK